ncbi:MAG: PEP-CTERM sorting domain-containing protein [Phycisphaeraceae bacterium]
MKVSSLIPAVACGAAVCVAGSAEAFVPPTLPDPVVSTFDSGLENWNALGFQFNDDNPLAILAGDIVTLTNNSADVIHDTGGDLDPAFDGNPGGFVRFIDNIEEPASFLRAPDAFTGDLSGFLGGTLSYDHRLFNEGVNPTSVSDYLLIIISGNPDDLNAYAASRPGPELGDADTDWVNVSFDLNASDFTAISQIDLELLDESLAGDTVESLTGGTFATSLSFEQVMSNVSQLVISFELVDNNSSQVSESAGVDNVRLAPVPEPSSIALVAMGALAIAQRRRRG